MSAIVGGNESREYALGLSGQKCDSPAVSVVTADELRGLGGGSVEPRRSEGGAQLAEVELAVTIGVEALEGGAHLGVERHGEWAVNILAELQAVRTSESHGVSTTVRVME